VNGFEVEVTLVPVDGLTLAGKLSYSDIFLSNIDPSLRSPVDGNCVSIYTPKWNGSISAQYTGQDIDSFRGAPFVGRIEAKYTSRSWGTPNSDAVTTEIGKVPTRWLVDARVGFTGFQIGDFDLEIAGYVKNLTTTRISRTRSMPQRWSRPTTRKPAHMAWT
jgi:outer membrane receptor protein involved in Fe transport